MMMIEALRKVIKRMHYPRFCRNSGMRASEAVWSADDQKASE